MKILLTSGGTKVQIDRVRHIGNMSHGTFGSRIARQLLLRPDVSLTFLAAEGSLTPFSFTSNFATSSSEEVVDKVYSLAAKYEACRDRYSERTYKTFADYCEHLGELLLEKPDVVMLAAAVSDYLVDNYVHGKIRSKDDLEIRLRPAPKLISSIKRSAPEAKLVGFKLLVDSTEEQLIAAARGSIVDNGCDLVVANDLRDIQQNNHTLLLVDRNGVERHVADKNDPEFLARVVADRVVKL